MHFKKCIIGSLITLAITAAATSTVVAEAVTGDISKFKSVGSEVSSKQLAILYNLKIIQRLRNSR